MVLKTYENTIRLELGSLKYILPGVLQQLSVSGDILMDSINTVNQSVAIPKGFREKRVSVSLLLLNTKLKKAEEQLQELENLFYKGNIPIIVEKEDEKTNTNSNTDQTTSSTSSKNTYPSTPVIYKIVNSHINKRSINHVVIFSFNSSESNSKDYINVDLTFEEVVSPEIVELENEGQE